MNAANRQSNKPPGSAGRGAKPLIVSAVMLVAASSLQAMTVAEFRALADRK